MSRLVLYAEVPGFYAEVERVLGEHEPERPLLVGGDPRKGGSVQSASAQAIAAGVVPGMTIREALARCPRARAVRTHMRRYREASSRLRACFRGVLDRLEPAGLGAAFFDVGTSEAEARAVAAELCGRVRESVGLPLRVGIAPAKFLARLAAQEAEPGAIHGVRAGEEKKFLDPLPVTRLPGVGPETEAKLRELGARTVGELSRLAPERVEAALGWHGRTVWSYAQGQDASPVRVTRHRKSLSQESSFDSEQLDIQTILEKLEELAGTLEQALELEGLCARRITLKLRYVDQEVVTRTRTLAEATTSANEIAACLGELLGRTQAGTRAVRGVGIALAGLRTRAGDDRQLSLFSPLR